MQWFQNAQVTWEVLLYILGAAGIVAIGLKAIAGFFNPYRDLRKKITTIESDNKKIFELLDNDNRRLKISEERQNAMLQALFSLIDHAITNNSIDGLKKTRTDLQVLLMRRAT